MYLSAITNGEFFDDFAIRSEEEFEELEKSCQHATDGNWHAIWITDQFKFLKTRIHGFD